MNQDDMESQSDQTYIKKMSYTYSDSNNITPISLIKRQNINLGSSSENNINKNKYNYSGQIQNFKQKRFEKQNNLQDEKQKINKSTQLSRQSINPLCLSTINFTNDNFAIQSQPNYMNVSFNKYFIKQPQNQSNFNLQKNNNFDQINCKKLSNSKTIFLFFVNFDKFKYIQKYSFQLILFYVRQKELQYKNSLNHRQYRMVQFVEKKNNFLHLHLNKQIHNKFNKMNINFNNKLIPIMGSQIISLEKQKILLKDNANLIKYNKQHYMQISEVTQIKPNKQNSINQQNQDQILQKLNISSNYKFNFIIHEERSLKNIGSQIKRNK